MTCRPLYYSTVPSPLFTVNSLSERRGFMSPQSLVKLLSPQGNVKRLDLRRVTRRSSQLLRFKVAWVISALGHISPEETDTYHQLDTVTQRVQSTDISVSHWSSLSDLSSDPSAWMMPRSLPWLILSPPMVNSLLLSGNPVFHGMLCSSMHRHNYYFPSIERIFLMPRVSEPSSAPGPSSELAFHS